MRRWIMVQCEHPGCTAVMRRNPHGKYRYRLCRPHIPVKRTPEQNAKAAASLKRFNAMRPDVNADRLRATNATLRRRLATEPDLAERYRENGRRVGLEHGGFIPEDTARRAAKGRLTKLAHIPAAYRDQYIALTRKRDGENSKMLAKDRARLILDQAEADARRFHAGLTKQED